MFSKKNESIFIVSGLPRSGTSMMMKMLEAGGIEPLTDGVRTPDDDNPKGYYEYERVKKLKEGDYQWLREAQGKAVKIIATLLTYLPSYYSYRVLFMRRAVEEILASQRKMLKNRGEFTDIDDNEMRKLFEKHLSQVYFFMNKNDNVRFLDVGYNQIIWDPESILSKIQTFLAQSLDIEEMVKVIDPTLYRQRLE